MKSLILGEGQIGKSVAKVIGTTDEVIIFDNKHQNEPPILRGIDIMHVCFPCVNQEEFLDNVHFYEAKYKPAHIVIWSTVPIGTTKQILNAIHSPIEGRHPKLQQSIRSMKRWFGVNTIEAQAFFVDYFMKLGLYPKPIPDSDFTEALKLLSTTEYGINIEFARYKKRVADELGMDYELTKQWNQDYNKLYHNLEMDWARKYVLDAPIGPKGGHCVTPNAVLLHEQFPNDLVKIVGEL